MTALAWLPPLIRILTTALLVVFASVAAEALGPFWGALIASLPVSTGPAYVFLAMQHGADFVAASALGSFAANAATGLFLTVYGILAGRSSRWRGLGIAILTWLAAAFAIGTVAWAPLPALLLNLAVYGAGITLLRAIPTVPPGAVAAAPRRWFHLPARALAVAGFVSLVVGASTLLGPAATGIVAVFPITLISLIVIVQPRIGGAAASLLAAGALRAMLGFGLMLLVLHLAVRPWGAPAALILALAVSATWSAGLLVLQKRRPAG